jgi:GNAT superfamily N-acetyltransferase
MPIEGINQPGYLEINSDLRLRTYGGHCDFALDWYQDLESLELIDGPGNAVPYTHERLKEMYDYLDRHGELYFIEKKQDDVFVPIGDVTFSENDMPIVISKEFRHRGIGSMVLQCLIDRAKYLGYKAIGVKEIYDFNTVSRHLFESNGFIKENSAENGATYVLHL